MFQKIKIGIRKNLFFLFIIFILTTISWYKILFLTFTGEGFFYFFNRLRTDNEIFRVDLGGYLFFEYLEPFFKDNLFLYQFILLLTFILLGILFYFIVYALTRNRSASLIASIFFTLNFNTVFEMIATGAYQLFVQRIFFLLILFPSFIFFIRFIQTKKISYFLSSLTLGIVSAFLAYFNFFYILFLLMYFLGVVFTKKMKIKEIIFLLSCTTIYILSTLITVNSLVIMNLIDGNDTQQSIFVYIADNLKELIFHFFRQLTVISIPDFSLRESFSVLNISYTEFIYRSDGIQYLFLPVFLIYILAGIFLFKREKKLRPVIVASLLFLPCIFVLNMFMRNEKVIILEPGNRYLFAPSIAFSIFWGIFLASLYNKSFKGKVFVSIAIVIWIGMQLISINQRIKEESVSHIATKKVIAYFKNDLSMKLKDDSIVITPRVMGNWGSDFLNKYYGKKNTIFIPNMDPQFKWRNDLKRTFDPNKDFITYYDYNRKEVIDLTKNYKTIIVR